MKIIKEEHLQSDQSVGSILKIDLNGICLHYQQENIMRFKDYFFDQFLDAITGEDEEEDFSSQDTQKWFIIS